MTHDEHGLAEIKEEIIEIQNTLDNLQISGASYEPFRALLLSSATCVTGTSSSPAAVDQDAIVIDSGAASGFFLVTGVILSPQGINDDDDKVVVDGLRLESNLKSYVIKTQDLTNKTIGAMAFEIMGSSKDDKHETGDFPHEIAARSTGVDDIEILLTCTEKSGGSATDITFDQYDIVVTGWKQPGSTVTVSYKENP